MARNRNLSLDPKDTLHPHLSGWFLFLILAAAIAALLHPAPARGQAGWPASGRPFLPRAISDGAGHLIDRTMNKIDSTGAAIWSLSTGWVIQTIEPDGAGGAMVLYNGSPGLLVGRVSTAGSVQWSSASMTNSFVGSGSQLIRLAVDGAGNAFASWKASNNLFVGKVSSAGAPQWGATGTLISNAANNLFVVNGALVPDEAGGCYLIWEDWRVDSSVPDIYLQHVLANGTAALAANGLGFATGAPTQGQVSACSDGAGGMIVAWRDNRDGDYDVYIQRVDGSGNSLWNAGGILLYTDPVNNIQDQITPYVLADGSGGAFVAWSDFRNGPSHGFDIYAQRVNSSGVFQWGVDGIQVFTTTNGETNPKVALDGAGGVFVSCTSATVAVQHLTAAGEALWTANGVRPSVDAGGAPDDMVPDGVGGCYFGSGGRLGRAFPNGKSAWGRDYQVAASVQDVPNDEGGWARLSFNRPAPDGGPVFGQSISAYSIWRKRAGTNNVGPARLHDPGAILTRIGSDPSVASHLTGYTDFPAGTWDIVDYTAVVPAVPRYSFLVPTHADSTVDGPEDEDFVVLSMTTGFGTFAVSPAFTGHSVDNLAPGAPQNLLGGRTIEGHAQLQWSPSGASDLWHYSVYRGNSPSFVPSASNRIGQPTSASFEDPGFEPGVSHYKVSTTDRHENESAFSLLTPSQIVSVPPGVNPGRTYISSAMPNPFGALTALEFGIAHRSAVVIEIYDMTGRRVRNLVHETRDPGVYRTVWDGSDDTRRPLPGGVYLARFEADGKRQSLKIVRTE